MRRFLVFIFPILFISLSLSGSWVSYGGFEGQGPEINVLEDRGTSITVEFRLRGYAVEQEDVNGMPCSKIILPGEVTYLVKGYPELPTISRNVIIPNNAKMSYRIISVEYETQKVNTLVPSKGNLYRNINPDDVRYTFDTFYKSNTSWPEETVEISEAFILRDYRGVSLRFNPFQYNPLRNEIRVVKSVVVEVYQSGNSTMNVLHRKGNFISNEFIGIYKSVFLNFSDTRYDSVSEFAGRMVIICADTYLSNMDAFVSWKRQKGIDTKMITVSSIGNNQTSIKNYIQSEYNAGGLVWVLLVGDGNEVVPAIGTIGSASGEDADPVYGYTAGGDYYPDIFISRFSSRNGSATNIDKQVSRSIDYERTPQTGANWYHIGLGVASNQGSPPDYERCNWLRDSLLQYTYTNIKDQYQGQGGSTNGIKQDIEAGLSIINYIGHGSTSGWSSVPFGISDVTSLNNPWMLPFVISVACLVGNFNGSDCYCEASVTAGTASDPDGFLVHWGSTISQSWVPPCIGQEGAVNHLTHDRYNTAGGIFFNGASYMIEYYGATNSDGVEMAQTWTIFGDASVQLRTDTPASMTVSHNSVIYFGTTTFDVTVTGVENALCALFRNDTLYGSAYTNASGFATININPPLTSSGDVKLTVTAYNKIPYIVDIPVQAASGPYISFQKGIIDDSGGNGNGRINPGETIDLSGWAENLGVDAGYGVYAKMSESDPYISMSDDSSWFGTIAAGDSVIGNPHYGFSVMGNCPDGHTILFDFTARDNQDSIWVSHPFFVVYSPALIIESFVVDPAGDQRLDPGETVDLLVTLKNDGSEDAPSVTGYLFENSSYISIPDHDGTFGDIPMGGSASNSGDPFVVHASSSTPIGETIDFLLEVTSGTYIDTLTFQITVGAKHYFIWDYDANTSSGPAIDAALQACGFSGDYNTSLPITQLDDYLAVFVCVGIYSNNNIITVGSPEATALVDFLNTGGRVYLEGGDVWYFDPQYENGYDFGPLFGINATSDGSSDLATVQGQSSTFTTGMNFSYSGENNWIDHISATGSGFLVFANSSPSYDCGVANDAGSYRTVGVSWEFGGLVDGSPPSTKEALADSIMHFFGIFVGVEEEPVNSSSLPKVYGLSQSYPNPSSRDVTIRYQLPRKGNVSLKVYDVSGRLIEVLTDGVEEAGYHSESLDTKGYASGVYFYRLKAGDKTFTRKMLVVR